MDNTYTKKPVAIEAYQMTTDRRQYPMDWPSWLFQAFTLKPTTPGSIYAANPHDDESELMIMTLEGEHRVSFGDFIIKGVKDELYPCKPDIFEATYSKGSDTHDTERLFVLLVKTIIEESYMSMEQSDHLEIEFHRLEATERMLAEESKEDFGHRQCELDFTADVYEALGQLMNYRKLHG